MPEGQARILWIPQDIKESPVPLIGDAKSGCGEYLGVGDEVRLETHDDHRQDKGRRLEATLGVATRKECIALQLGKVGGFSARALWRKAKPRV